MNFSAGTRLTAVVAGRHSGAVLDNCLNSLAHWTKIILVAGRDIGEDEASRHASPNCTLSRQDSADPADLWSAGLRLCDTPWVLLIHSNETVTGQLRRAIQEKILADPVAPAAFSLPRLTVFLSKRLKRPLRWSTIPDSALAGFPPGSRRVVPGPSLCAGTLSGGGGNLIAREPDTLSTSFPAAHRRGEMLADRLYASASRPESCAALVFSAAKHAATSLLNTLIRQNALRDRFEGAAFAAADLATAIFAHLRYCEKYLRPGKTRIPDPQKLQRILVIKLRDIGDNILATPCIRNLKQLLPQASISILTYSYSRAVFENSPYVRHIYEIAKNPSSTETDSLVAELNAQAFDLAINLHAGGLSSGILSRLKAGGKINNHYIGYDRAGNIHAPESAYYRSAIERDLDCLRALGLEPAGKMTELHPTENELREAREYLAGRGLDLARPLVLVHPTASVEIREWEMHRFAQLIGKLRDRNVQVAVLCAANELPRLRELEPASAPVIHDLSLRLAMAVIRHASLVIDNDSAPSHIATAFGVPALVLFSQAVREIFRPYDEKTGRHAVLYRDVPCRECGLDRCDNRICLDFTVDEVLERAMSLLAAPGGNR